MSTLALTITDAGRAEIINADNTGIGPVTIAYIAIGDALYIPSKGQTQLQNEINRFSSFGGEVVADDVIHVTVMDESLAEYTLGEFGLISDQGTLIAVYAQQTPILEKNAQGIMLLSADMTLTTLDTANITFGPAEFVYPPATLIRAGVVQLSNEVDSTREDQAATPKAVKSANDNANARLPAASYTAADVLAKLKTVDGPDSGLDADLLDGKQLATIESEYAAADALKLDKTGGTLTGSVQISVPTNADSSISLFEDSNNHGIIFKYTGATDNILQIIGRSANVETVGLTMDRTVSTSGLKYKNNSVWHAGNHGPGSGLNADLLDGKQLSLIESEYQAADTATLNSAKGYTDTQVAALVDSSPLTLDTLNELAAALGDDPNFATTMTTQLGLKLNAASYTATDVLAKLKTVDGPGSGLDADYLDGLNSSSFARTYPFEPGNSAGLRRWVRLCTLDGVAGSAGTAVDFILAGTGDLGDSDRCALRVMAGQRGSNGTNVDVYSLNKEFVADAPDIHYVNTGTYTFEVWARLSDYNRTHYLTVLNRQPGVAVTVDNITTAAPVGAVSVTIERIWNTQNHGAGSGLDADLLDGQEGSFYRNASNLNDGTVPVERLPNASTDDKGAVQLSNSVTSDSQDTAATSKAVSDLRDELLAPDGEAFADGSGWAVIGKMTTPSGIKPLIKQWGSAVTVGSNGTYNFNLPIAFPNSILKALPVAIFDNGTASIANISETQVAGTSLLGTSNAPAGLTIDIEAIGY